MALCRDPWLIFDSLDRRVPDLPCLEIHTSIPLCESVGIKHPNVIICNGPPEAVDLLEHPTKIPW